MKKKYLKVAGIVLLFITILLFGIAVTRAPVEQRTYIGKNEEMITMTSRDMRLIDWVLEVFNIGEQAAWKSTSAEYGERVELCDFITRYHDSQRIFDAGFTVEDIDRQQSIVGGYFDLNYDMTSWGKTYCVKFNTEIANVGDRLGGWTVLDLCRFMYYDGTRCSVNLHKEFIEPDNILTIKEAYEPDPICDKNPYWSGWFASQSQPVSNGLVQERTRYEVDNNCRYYEARSEQRLLCNDGYLVEGTQDSTSMYTGRERCVRDEPDDPEPECESDVTEECPNGDRIVIKACIGGRLFDTGLTCPEPQDPVTAGYSIINDECQYVEQNAEYDTRSECIESLRFRDRSDWRGIAITIVFIFAILIVITLSYLIIRRVRGGRR